MLGISGFESSANFVEEQRRDVFPKTLKYMWLVVSVFNPLMAVLALALIPIGHVPDHQEALLSHMGAEASGQWLRTMISIDAALVLSGAVLTSFVGVNGLVGRMTLDRCLPQFLLKTNPRGTTHRIIIAFFLLTVSVLLITRGDLPALAGVYTLSFLSVMLLFGFGNILLKLKRATLPRPAKASWPTVLLAMLAVGVGLIGNALLNPSYLAVFLEYFIPAFLIVSLMLGRIKVLEALLFITRKVMSAILKPMHQFSDRVRSQIDDINSQQFVFFTRGDNLSNLNRVMLYIRRNEHTSRIKIVHVTAEGDKLPSKLEKDIQFLDEAYPDVQINLELVKGNFSPHLISSLSRRWKIPTNFMFIGCPGGGLTHDLAEFGGVRIIV
jgi:hypothetical protein